jgi:hypothetical protein
MGRFFDISHSVPVAEKVRHDATLRLSRRRQAARPDAGRERGVYRQTLRGDPKISSRTTNEANAIASQNLLLLRLAPVGRQAMARERSHPTEAAPMAEASLPSAVQTASSPFGGLDARSRTTREQRRDF